MLKKFVFSLILAIFIFGIMLLLPKKISESPNKTSPSPFSFLGMVNKKEPETTIILTGDIMLGRSVMNESFNKKDFTYPFKNVAETLRNASLVFGNLETPITKDCPRNTSGMIFCADPQMLSGLKFAGVDIVSIANNHTKNYGEDGFRQTQEFLSADGIDFVGAENLVIKEINGIKFGFLGFNFVDKRPTDLEYQLIKDSKTKVSTLIVMVHWGNEYTESPTLSQKEIAMNLINNGADVVVGGHPHWVQGIDRVNGKPIFYSLGNFVFDQAWSEDTKKGLTVRLTYKKGNLTKIEEMPTYMESFAQPKFID